MTGNVGNFCARYIALFLEFMVGVKGMFLGMEGNCMPWDTLKVHGKLLEAMPNVSPLNCRASHERT